MVPATGEGLGVGERLMRRDERDIQLLFTGLTDDEGTVVDLEWASEVLLWLLLLLLS